MTTQDAARRLLEAADKYVELLARTSENDCLAGEDLRIAMSFCELSNSKSIASICRSYLTLSAANEAMGERLKLAEGVLDDIACERQNLHGRLDDCDTAELMCEMADKYFINRNDDERIPADLSADDEADQGARDGEKTK